MNLLVALYRRILNSLPITMQTTSRHIFFAQTCSLMLPNLNNRTHMRDLGSSQGSIGMWDKMARVHMLGLLHAARVLTSMTCRKILQSLETLLHSYPTHLCGIEGVFSNICSFFLDGNQIALLERGALIPLACVSPITPSR